MSRIARSKSSNVVMSPSVGQGAQPHRRIACAQRKKVTFWPPYGRSVKRITLVMGGSLHERYLTD